MHAFLSYVNEQLYLLNDVFHSGKMAFLLYTYLLFFFMISTNGEYKLYGLEKTLLIFHQGIFDCLERIYTFYVVLREIMHGMGF